MNEKNWKSGKEFESIKSFFFFHSYFNSNVSGHWFKEYIWRYDAHDGREKREKKTRKKIRMKILARDLVSWSASVCHISKCEMATENLKRFLDCQFRIWKALAAADAAAAIVCSQKLQYSFLMQFPQSLYLWIISEHLQLHL